MDGSIIKMPIFSWIPDLKCVIISKGGDMVKR